METLNIFEYEDETYYLVNKRGRRVPGAEWVARPRLQSGVFLATSDKLFTVLGDEVKLNASEILAIINFWVYYRKGPQRYIARLEPLGLKFRIKVETAVDDVGFLSHEGCVVLVNSEWLIYNYDFGTLIQDSTVPDVQITVPKIWDLLKKGFTEPYLLHLAKDTLDMTLVRALNEGKTDAAWDAANEDFHKIIIKLSELIDDYSAEEIGSILGLKTYIVSVIAQYLEIYDFVSEKSESE